MVPSPERTQRDHMALRWTMESLTEASELEPFVDGISGFITSEDVDGVSVLVPLLRTGYNDLSDLNYRIMRLLSTCYENEKLDPITRQRRAVACLTAIWSLVNHTPSSTTGFDGIHAASACETFLNDPSSTIITYARCTMMALFANVLKEADESRWSSDTYRFKPVLLVWAMRGSKGFTSSQSACHWELRVGKITTMHFDRYDIWAESDRSPNPFILQKIINESRCLALIDFVVTLVETGFTPKEALETLLSIVMNLTLKTTDPRIQKLFVDTLAIAIRHLPRLPAPMIDELLPLTATLDDPSVIEYTNNVIAEYAVARSDTKAVDQALALLEAKRDTPDSFRSRGADSLVKYRSRLQV
jgi:hypothetical protein